MRRSPIGDLFFALRSPIGDLFFAVRSLIGDLFFAVRSPFGDLFFALRSPIGDLFFKHGKLGALSLDKDNRSRALRHTLDMMVGFIETPFFSTTGKLGLISKPQQCHKN